MVPAVLRLSLVGVLLLLLAVAGVVGRPTRRAAKVPPDDLCFVFTPGNFF